MLRVHAEDERNRGPVWDHIHKVLTIDMRTEDKEKTQRRGGLDPTRLPEETAREARELAQQRRAPVVNEKLNSDYR